MKLGNIRGFGPETTAAEVVQGVDLRGKTAVVTGAASGIGVETARALAAAGAAVTLAVRDLTAGEATAADIRSSTGSESVSVAALELSDIASVDDFVRAWQGPLDILVNNAGVMDSPLSYTDAGWESQFAVNHLGHFALAVGLHDALAAAGHARIVSVSSSGHGSSPVVFDDLFFQRRAYEPGLGYGQSKTANVLFAVEVTRRWAADGITANALMPGGIWTKLQRHWDPARMTELKATPFVTMKTPAQGAATSVLLATAPELEGIGGRYFEDCHEADVVPEIVDWIFGVREYAVDPDAAQRLWDVSQALLDVEHFRLSASSSAAERASA